MEPYPRTRQTVAAPNLSGCVQSYHSNTYQSDCEGRLTLQACFHCQLAKVQGYDPSLIKSVPSATAVGRVTSPSDISMDVSRIQQELGIHLTPFEDALRTMFADSAAPVPKA
jgi:dTDP-4-dehydrorhamnose reductase